MIDREAYEAQKADRARDKQRLLDALFADGLLPEDYPRAADGIPELTAELHHAITGILASTPCAALAGEPGRYDQRTVAAEPAGHDGRVSELEPQNALVDRGSQ